MWKSLTKFTAHVATKLPGGSARLFAALLWAGICANPASAQLFDDIVLKPTSDGKVIATIKLNSAVQYLRHFPQNKGRLLEIYYNVLVRGSAPSALPDNEILNSPPSDLIPGFTVTAQDQSTLAPKLLIQFSRPVEYSVRLGKNSRSFDIIIQPPAAAPDVLDMGEIKINSALGEPLDAEIELFAVGKETRNSLVARLASPTLFKSMGVKYPDDFPKLEFRIASRADGEPYIKVISTEPIKIPQVKLLVQLKGPVDLLVREYSLSLPAPAPIARTAPEPSPVREKPAAIAASKSVAPEVVAQAAEPAPQSPSVTKPEATPPAGVTTPASPPPSIVVPQPLPEPVAPQASSLASSAPTQPTAQMEETNKQAEALMEKGRAALQQGDHGIAIDAFNKVLMLPPNKFSQDAQELIGVAREHGGQIFKAKLEYELYLKTYPSGDGVARVKEHLSRLSAPVQQAQAASQANKLQARPINREFQTMTYGSLSAYYYNGSSQTQILPAIGSVSPPTNLSTTDQSLLLGNVTANLRVRNDEYDNRLAFQDTYAKNFLPVRFGTNANANKLNVLYYDLKNRIANYSARLGRQSSSGGGVMGRFDGAATSYGFTPQWHANATAGRLVEFTDNAKPIFYGAGIDGSLADQRWGGSLYAINQTIDGVTDRRAVGGEVRYFDTSKTANLMLDYDTSFNAVNIASLQGTLNSNNMETTYNFLLDHRKTPSLSIRNALNGATVTSISALLQNGWAVQDIHDLAKVRTATTNQIQVGVTHKLRENWQIGGNASVAQTTGLPSSGTLLPDGTIGIEGFQVASPPTGLSRTFSGQLVGSNIFSKHDVTVFSASLTKSPLVQGQTYLVSNRAVVFEKWTLDNSLRLYWQKDNTGGKEDIITPSVKLSYQAADRITLEGEAGFEVINNAPGGGGGALTKTTRKFFSLGGHSDF